MKGQQKSLCFHHFCTGCYVSECRIWIRMTTSISCWDMSSCETNIIALPLWILSHENEYFKKLVITEHHVVNTSSHRCRQIVHEPLLQRSSPSKISSLVLLVTPVRSITWIKIFTDILMKNKDSLILWRNSSCKTLDGSVPLWEGTMI